MQAVMHSNATIANRYYLTAPIVRLIYQAENRLASPFHSREIAWIERIKSAFYPVRGMP